MSSSRGRGRGRGAPPTTHCSTHVWVRPSTQEARIPPSIGTAVASQQRKDIERGDNGKFGSVPAGVILKGPKQRYAKFPARSHSWKRPREVTGSSSVPDTVQDDKVEAIASVAVASEKLFPDNGDSRDKSSTMQSISKPAAEQPSSMMVRRGRHKLIISQKPKEKSPDLADPLAENTDQNGAATATNATSNKDGSMDGTSLPMQKWGRNKLVLAKNESDSTQDVKRSVTQEGESMQQAGSTDGQTETGDKKLTVLCRKGNNKLVLQHADRVNDKKGKWENCNGTHVQSNRGRGRGRGIGLRHGVKRIKLNPSEEDTAEDGGEFDETGLSVEPVPSQAAAGDKYTEFAYRQSSTVSLRGRGRGRGMRGTGGVGATARGRNMGLVRVEPDATTTRMCPAYLRGEPCTNPTCRKRHDVPMEAAIPICSFFQRNGLCNRGDACPFRHIKVNPRATLCPSFSLLGFCENKDCVMKHIRAPKSKQRA